MTLQCLVVDGHEMERYVCLRCCLIFDMKDKVVLDHYLGFTLNSHHNFFGLVRRIMIHSFCKNRAWGTSDVMHYTDDEELCKGKEQLLEQYN